MGKLGLRELTVSAIRSVENENPTLQECGGWDDAPVSPNYQEPKPRQLKVKRNPDWHRSMEEIRALTADSLNKVLEDTGE